MSDVRRLLAFLRPYRREAALALLMLTALIVLDLAIPRLVQRIIDQGIGRGDRGVVLQTAIAMLAISAVSTLIAIANNVYSIRAGEGLARDLREALFLAIQRFSFGNLDHRKTGELLVRLTSDVAQVKQLAQISLRIGTRAPLMMIGSLALMIVTSRGLAFTMLPLLAVTTLFIVLFVVKTEPLFRRVQQRLDAVNGVLQENIAGARVVKALVRADHEAARFEVTNEAMTLQSIRTMQIMSTMQPVLTMCINVGVALVVWMGGAQSIRGELSLGETVAFTNYLLSTMAPLVMMTLLSNTWAAGLASLRRVLEVLDTEPEVKDAPGAIALPEGAEARVAFDDVTFAYPGETNEAVLRDVTLEAKPGQTVAVLGSTGAGKSTLVSLIPRFYDATSGAVRAFGHDVREVTQDSLVSRIGVVPQETILFSGTVRDNIRYGRPEASDDEVERAAKAAQAHDFIAQRAEGYDSRVEQRGANLSGGQKQRLAIARALLVDPDVLILDDATSAVDVETETRLQRALAGNESSKKRTTFVVAQRISTVLEADVILVLEKGEIVARGTHAELLESSPLYREIYDSQLGGEMLGEGTRT